MPQWLNDAVFYEIYPQSFYDSNGDGIGDINGVTAKLDYVKSLGCNAIWLNPCFDSPFLDAGYDVRDYKKVAPRYGVNEDLERCFQEAHARGIRIVLDLVPGHTSDQHPWFQQSQLQARNPYSDRYIWTSDEWDRARDFPCVCGMSERAGCYLLNFFNSQPALNYGFARVTERWQMPYTAEACRKTFDAVLDVMRFWLDRGCDGFRVDMAASLVKNDDDKAATSELWQRARAMLDAEYPEAVLISEWSDPPKAIPAGFHADFYLNDDDNGYFSLLRDPDQRYFSKKGAGDIHRFLAQYLPWYAATRGKGHISLITCNHDTQRPAPLLDPDELKVAYAFLFTMPGVPFLYYGDEIGMRYRNLVSKEGGYRRTGSRTPMQWNQGENLGFSPANPGAIYLPVDPEPDAPTVSAQEGQPDSLLAFVRALLTLRHTHPDLQSDAPFSVVYDADRGYPFVYRRGDLLCAVNPSATSCSAPVRAGAGVFSHGGARADGNAILLPAQSFGVFQDVNA